MQEQEVLFSSGEIELSGTLTLPDSGGPFPGVVFLAGSGQVDRNENHRKLPINAFCEISDYLVQNGIASLRYDKRGVGLSGGDYWATGFYDNTEDAAVALRFMQQQADIQSERVFILGHSEGTFIATRLAGSGVEPAGLILLSGGAQSGEAELKWQAVQVMQGLKGLNSWLIKILRIDVSRAQQKQIDKIKNSKGDWFKQQLFMKINAKWMREFLSYDPAQDLPKITVPVLAITGTKDIQVDPNDLELMANLIQSPFEKHLIPDMTHVLRKDEGMPTISNYQQQVQRPVTQELLYLILHWLQRQCGTITQENV